MIRFDLPVMECEEEMSDREKDLHQTVFPDGLRECAKG
jgi:hypothetical protein